MEKIYDSIVIGAGPAGMTAALYLARSNLTVLLLEQGAPGGQMNNTAEIENYPGFASIMGPDLARKMYDPLTALGVVNAYGIVTEVVDHGQLKDVICEDQSYQSKTVVIATGAVHRKLAVAGEDEYSGRGVSYCAVCDGPFFKDKELIVVGGGDSAVEEAIYLTRFAGHVTIVHRRDQLRAQQIIQQHAFSNDQISFLWDSVVKEIKGDDRVVQEVVIENVKTHEQSLKKCGGVFIYVGLDAQSQPFSKLEILDSSGWVKTDSLMHTKVAGIFAAGDVRQKTLRQITTAVGEGGTAAQQVYLYLQNF